MKTIVWLLFSFFVVDTCSAQIPAGTKFIGGGASFSHSTVQSKSTSNDSYKIINTSYRLNPQIGYFVSNNLAIGLGVDFFNEKVNYKRGNSPDGSINKSFGVRPFSRYYKMLGERAGFFGQLSVFYSQGKSKYGEFTSGKFNKTGVDITPGFVFFATPKIGIETIIGSLGYLHSKTKDYNPTYDTTNENSSNLFEASVKASNILLGVNFYLGR